MVAPEVLSTNEHEFLLSALKDGIRLDGRSAYQIRDLSATLSNSTYGQVELTLGKTSVFAHVSSRIVPPQEHHVSEGIFTLQVHPPPNSDANLQLSRTLEKALRRSRCIDTEGLCLISEKFVFHIELSLHVLEDDGNTVDACMMAALIALTHFKRPEVTVRGEELTIWKEDEKPFVGLAVKFMPVAVSFAGFEGDLLVADPTHTELSLAQHTLTVALTPHNEVCFLSSFGAPIELDTIMRCIQIAQVKVKDMVSFIKDTVAKNKMEGAAAPSTGGLMDRKGTKAPSA